MKFTLERVTFMIIGALIASIAYFIGSTNPGVEAENRVTTFDKIMCKS